MNCSEIANELSLSKEEIRDFIESERGRMTADAVADMISSICKQETPEDRQLFIDMPIIEKIEYIALEIYLRGFMVALYTYTEAVKEYLYQGINTEKEGTNIAEA